MSRKHRRKQKQTAAPPPKAPAAPVDNPLSTDDALTERERRFVEEYILDPNATQAYKRAFQCKSYVTAKTEGCRLLTNPNVDAEIAAARKAQSARTRITADRVLKEVAGVGFADAGDMFDDAGQLLPVRKMPAPIRRAIQAVKVKKTKVYGAPGAGPTGEEEVVEVKLAGKDAALGRLMKHLGLVKELAPIEVLLGYLSPAVRRQLAESLAKGEYQAGDDPGGAGESERDADAATV